MNNLAVELNAILQETVAGRLLSALGKRLYFPKGIVAQSAEAKKHAKRLNATIGLATKGGVPMFLPSIRNALPGLNPDEIFPYAPTQGVQDLREFWKKEMLRKNPGLAGKAFSLPLVVPGLTAGISILADLFADAGDVLILPDKHWDNYPLIFDTRREARVVTFPFYDGAGFNLDGLRQAMKAEAGRGKLILILNFPNNPTGYSPTEEEARRIVEAVRETAASGASILAITDDAYFGLFYEKGTCTQSLFAPLADAHENVLAAKVDGSTKEDLTWGFRTGFLSFAAKGMTEKAYDALVAKLMGAVRSTVSNSSILAQSLILRASQSAERDREKTETFQEMERRYRKAKEAVSATPSAVLSPLPFNSGYFMSFRLEKGNAEDLRKALLMEEGVGTIAIDPKCLRVAYSSVDLDRIEELYRTIYRTADRVLK